MCSGTSRAPASQAANPSRNHAGTSGRVFASRHQRLVSSGCEIVKDEPDFSRCYVKDPFGPIYRLTRGQVTER
jgi:hypothetical protein